MPNDTILNSSYIQNLQSNISYGDKVYLGMSTIGNNVVLAWKDWNTGTEGFAAYNDAGSYFTASQGNAFTGLMTEYHYHTPVNRTIIPSVVYYQPVEFIPQNVTVHIQEARYAPAPFLLVFDSPHIEYPTNYFNISQQYFLNWAEHGNSIALFQQNGTFVTSQWSTT